MTEIDWKKKLTSRKFWAAVCALVTQIAVACGATEDTTVKITALITAAATVIAYIIGEGLVDAANAKKEDPIILVQQDEPPEEDEDEVNEEDFTEDEING